MENIKPNQEPSVLDDVPCIRCGQTNMEMCCRVGCCKKYTDWKAEKQDRPSIGSILRKWFNTYFH